MSGPMELKVAMGYAEKIVEWLGPYCEVMEIAGSIRRKRPVVNDVDIVCVPKVSETRDMLGETVERKNHCLDFLQRYVAEYKPARGSPILRPAFISGGEKEGQQVMVQLPKCKLDLWFADWETLATRWLCRTGSADHNIWLCERAAEQNGKWEPYKGVKIKGVAIPGPTEACIYAALGLKFIEPENREMEWIKKHVQWGLE